MANERVFLAQALTTNGEAVGGMASIGFNAAYRSIVKSRADGAVGVQDVDVAGLAVDVSCDCTDVAKVNAIIAAAVGDTTFYGRESGAATWQKRTVPGISWHGANLDFGRDADGRMSLSGKIRFADGTKTLKDVIQTLGGQTQEPSETYPARLYRPNSATFTPGSVINLEKHLVSVGFVLAATNVLEDSDDDGIGMTAVDVVDWDSLRVSLVHKDASQINGGDRSAELIEAGVGALSVPLMGRGGGAAKTLLINNMVWTGVNEQKAGDYWTFTMTGEAGWRSSGGTVYTVNGANKLFSIS